MVRVLLFVESREQNWIIVSSAIQLIVFKAVRWLDKYWKVRCMCDDEDPWTSCTFLMQFDMYEFLYLLSWKWIKMFFTEVSYWCFFFSPFWGHTVLYVEIIHTEEFIISAYYSRRKLGAIFSSDFCACVASCRPQISQECSRHSGGGRKRVQRGKCMQILGVRAVSAAAAVHQGRLWVLALWAQTLITCDVINQKSVGSYQWLICIVKVQLLEKLLHL